MSNDLEQIKKNEKNCDHAPTNTYRDDGIEPLSGKPFFHKYIERSHIGGNHKYCLTVPTEFTTTLPNNTVPATLARGEKIWEMSYCGDCAHSKAFDQRWRAFAEDNQLKVGDFCIFELMECCDLGLKFKVQVLRGDFPSVLLDKQNGSRDNPIMLE